MGEEQRKVKVASKHEQPAPVLLIFLHLEDFERFHPSPKAQLKIQSGVPFTTPGAKNFRRCCIFFFFNWRETKPGRTQRTMLLWFLKHSQPAFVDGWVGMTHHSRHPFGCPEALTWLLLLKTRPLATKVALDPYLANHSTPLLWIKWLIKDQSRDSMDSFLELVNMLCRRYILSWRLHTGERGKKQKEMEPQGQHLSFRVQPCQELKWPPDFSAAWAPNSLLNVCLTVFLSVATEQTWQIC